MRKIISPLYIAALFFVSCSNEDKRSTGASTVQTSSSSNTAAVPASTTPTANQQAQPAALPATNQPAQTATALPPLNNNLTTTKLNPPHGQPGHDCSVEVGKPLPSAGAIKPTPVPLNNPVQTTPAVNVTPQPAATVTPPVLTPNLPAAKAGLNPEHGKPGHRCDIAVGAPLNSAPAQTASPTVTPTTKQNELPQKISVPTVSANPPAPLPAAATTAAGLNPEHGKPGHRCDIAVGAPLPKQ